MTWAHYYGDLFSYANKTEFNPLRHPPIWGGSSLQPVRNSTLVPAVERPSSDHVIRVRQDRAGCGGQVCRWCGGRVLSTQDQCAAPRSGLLLLLGCAAVRQLALPRAPARPCGSGVLSNTCHASMAEGEQLVLLLFPTPNARSQRPPPPKRECRGQVR